MELPIFGLGTYKLTSDACYHAISYALTYGYRLIDTARCYRNEKEIGNALNNSKITRNEIFITSKVATNEMEYQKAYNAVKIVLANIGVCFLFCFIITLCNKI